MTRLACRYGEYIGESAWFKADKRQMWGGDVERVMQKMKDRFHGYLWHPEQGPEDAVYNTWAVLDFLNGYSDGYPWCNTGTLLSTLTRHAPAILATRSCMWADLTSPLSPQSVGSSMESHNLQVGVQAE